MVRHGLRRGDFFQLFRQSPAAHERTGYIHGSKGKGKGKAVPLQAWTDPEVSRKLRFPDFVTTARDGGRLPLPPGNTPGTHLR